MAGRVRGFRDTVTSGNDTVTDRVHAAVQDVKPARLQSMTDGAAADAQRGELRPGHNPMLALRERSDVPIHPTPRPSAPIHRRVPRRPVLHLLAGLDDLGDELVPERKRALEGQLPGHHRGVEVAGRHGEGRTSASAGPSSAGSGTSRHSTFPGSIKVSSRRAPFRR